MKKHHKRDVAFMLLCDQADWRVILPENKSLAMQLHYRDLSQNKTASVLLTLA